MEKLAEQTELATTADLIYQQPERNAEVRSTP